MDYSAHINPKTTPQTKPIFGREPEMTQNSAGGFSFQLDPWKQFARFLILGTEGGSYYAGERELTIKNTENLVNCIKQDGLKSVQEILRISLNGLAPKNDPAIFALALCCTHGAPEVKKEACAAISKVCRTGTHLFTFCQAVKSMRKWSRGLRSGVADFYVKRSADEMAYQLVKYRQRNGWTHKDVIRLAHPKKLKEAKARLALKAVGKDLDTYPLPAVYAAFEEAQKLTKTEAKQAAALIRDSGLPWEALPTELLNETVVWEALLPKIGLNALLRNLSRLTKLGLVTKHGLDDTTKFIAGRFENQEAILKSRLHPLNILNGLQAYAAGVSPRNNERWIPSQRVVTSLYGAYKLAFGNVTPTGKNYLLALDVSGSMSGPMIAGTALTPRVASTALAMVTQSVEDTTFLMGFSNRFIHLAINRQTSLGDACAYTESLPFSSTDCSLPMIWAIQEKAPVDVFVVYTDSETFAGRIHPSIALEAYRQKQGRDAKLIVVGMVSNSFTIADPQDPRQLDIVGFSLDTPQAISSFSDL